MKYSVGDVVYVPVPFEDGKGVKPRPLIIFKVVPDKLRYVGCECYSDKEHYSKNKGSLIKEGTELYKEMGLKEDSFICDSIKAVYEVYVIKKMGHYKHVHELMDRLRRKLPF